MSAASACRLLLLLLLHLCSGRASDEVELVQGVFSVNDQVTRKSPSLDADGGCSVMLEDARTQARLCSRVAVHRVQPPSCFNDVPAVEEGEKTVYFLRHALHDCKLYDGALTPEGEEQCNRLRENSTVLRPALFGEPHEQVQVVFMSPTARTIHTAIKLFGDMNVPMVIDRRLVEAHNLFKRPCVVCAEEVMSLGHFELMKPYHQVLEDSDLDMKYWAENPEERVADFTRTLLERMEKVIAVVSHFRLLHHFHVGAGCMGMGEDIAVGALSPSGVWRRLAADSCSREGDRRRRMRTNLANQMLG